MKIITFGSYSEIMEQFSISKPTLIKLFKDLADKKYFNKNFPQKLTI